MQIEHPIERNQPHLNQRSIAVPPAAHTNEGIEATVSERVHLPFFTEDQLHDGRNKGPNMAQKLNRTTPAPGGHTPGSATT